jgi:hypothetical protein
MAFVVAMVVAVAAVIVRSWSVATIPAATHVRHKLPHDKHVACDENEVTMPIYEFD